MKCSGMRWKQNGTGQPVLSMRALCKSGRFHAAWREIIHAPEPPPYHLLRRKSGSIAKLMN